MISPSTVTSPRTNFGKTMTLPGSWELYKVADRTCGSMAMAESTDPSSKTNPARATRTVLIGFMLAPRVALSDRRGASDAYHVHPNELPPPFLRAEYRGGVSQASAHRQRRISSAPAWRVTLAR